MWCNPRYGELYAQVYEDDDQVPTLKNVEECRSYCLGQTVNDGEYETIMYTWFPNFYCGPYTLYDYDVENGRYFEHGYELEHSCELRSADMICTCFRTVLSLIASGYFF